VKEARLTPAVWRSAQTADTGRGRPNKGTAERTWQLLTHADATLRIESLLPPKSLLRRLNEDEQAKAEVTAKKALVVVLAAVVAAARRQAPVTFALALDAIALRWSATFVASKVARLTRQMTVDTAHTVVREIMETGIRLDAAWRLAVSGPWSCDSEKAKPKNPLYRTTRVALGPYDVALRSAVHEFETLVLGDDAYHEVEPLNVRRVAFAGTKLPPRKTRQDVVAEWAFNVAPSGANSARTFALLETTQLQVDGAAIEKDLADATTARTEALNALRARGISPTCRSKRIRWDGLVSLSKRERQIMTVRRNKADGHALETLAKAYDRADATVGLLHPVVAQIARYSSRHPGLPVRIRTQMFRAPHGRFYPSSFWPIEASTRATPWGPPTRPRWFKDRDGRPLIEYDVSASQSQVMGVFLGLRELEAAACSTKPRFKEYLAALAWRMVTDKAMTATKPRCTDMTVQFRDVPNVPAYVETHEIDGRIVYDSRLVAMVKQAWMTYTYGSPPAEVIETLRKEPERYGPGFGGEYVRTITRGKRKGQHVIDGAARSLMEFFRALPWFAETTEYLSTCKDIADAVDDYVGFAITDPLDRRTLRWNPVAVRPLTDIRSVGGNRIRLDAACVVGKLPNAPLRIGQKMETADGYSWIEYDEIQPRAKYRTTYQPATANGDGDYAIDRSRLQRQIAPQIIHLLDSYFAALVVHGLHNRNVRDMVVVHDAFCVAEADVPALLSAIDEASEGWFLGLGPVYESLLTAAKDHGLGLPLIEAAHALWVERCKNKDFPHFTALPA